MNIVEIALSFQLAGTTHLPHSFFNYYSCFHLKSKKDLHFQTIQFLFLSKD